MSRVIRNRNELSAVRRSVARQKPVQTRGAMAVLPGTAGQFASSGRPGDRLNTSAAQGRQNEVRRPWCVPRQCWNFGPLWSVKIHRPDSPGQDQPRQAGGEKGAFHCWKKAVSAVLPYGMGLHGLLSAFCSFFQPGILLELLALTPWTQHSGRPQRQQLKDCTPWSCWPGSRVRPVTRG